MWCAAEQAGSRDPASVALVHSAGAYAHWPTLTPAAGPYPTPHVALQKYAQKLGYNIDNLQLQH